MSLVDLSKMGIPAIGILAITYGLACTILARPSGRKPKVARGFYVWPNTLSVILAGLTTVSLLIFHHGRFRSVTGIASSFLIGWGLGFALFFASRAVGRKLSTEDSTNQARLGYCLLSASGYMLCASAILGGALLVLDNPAWETVGIRQVIAVSLGFWLAATFWSVPSALYRWLLAQEMNAGPGEISPLSVQFRSTPGETAFLVTAALACAVALAEFRFQDGNEIARLYPAAMVAISTFFAMLVGPLLKPANHNGTRRRRVLEWFGVLAYMALTMLSAYLLASAGLRDLRAFYAFVVGLVTAILLIFTARYRPPFTQVGSPFGMEIAITQVLMVIGAAVIAFRSMSGYGVALCAVGLLSSLSILFPIGALWAAHRTTDDLEEIDLPFMAHAASRFAEIVTAGGSFLLIVVLIRLFRERSGLGTAGVDITDPYPLVSLVAGGTFPILMRVLSQPTGVTLSVATFERHTLVKLGRWAGIRTIAVWSLVGITPLLVAFFGRMESAGAFLVGLAASELLLIVTLWFGEVKNTADEGIRLATRAAHLLSVGTGLVTVLLIPPFVRMTEEVPRWIRLLGLAGILMIALVTVFITAYTRQRKRWSQ